eukprot:Lithocolla_globosa_v1_NODE_904_length_3103_cov_4.257874.p4 type:complete len:119 gc:universal NODE_904_length_3103_cov_4.257874:1252-896(-)
MRTTLQRAGGAGRKHPVLQGTQLPSQLKPKLLQNTGFAPHISRQPPPSRTSHVPAQSTDGTTCRCSGFACGQDERVGRAGPELSERCALAIHRRSHVTLDQGIFTKDIPDCADETRVR